MEEADWLARIRTITNKVVDVATATLRANGLSPPASSPVRFCEVAIGLCRVPLVDSVRRSKYPPRYEATALGVYDPDLNEIPPGLHSVVTRATMRYVPEHGWQVDAIESSPA